MIICSTTQLLLVFSKKWTYSRQAPQLHQTSKGNKNTTHAAAQQAGKVERETVSRVWLTFPIHYPGSYEAFTAFILSACSFVTSLILIFSLSLSSSSSLSACGFLTSLLFRYFPSLFQFFSLCKQLCDLSLILIFSLSLFMFSLSACSFLTSLSYSNVFSFPLSLSSSSSSLSLCMQLCDLSLLFLCPPPFSLSLSLSLNAALWPLSLILKFSHALSLSLNSLSVSVSLFLCMQLYDLSVSYYELFPGCFVFLWSTSCSVQLHTLRVLTVWLPCFMYYLLLSVMVAWVWGQICEKPGMCFKTKQKMKTL